LIFCTRVTRDGLGVHGSMFPRHHRYNSGGSSFSGTLSGGWILCAEVERGSGEVEREKVDGMGLMTAGVGGKKGGRKERGSDTRPLGRDEGAQSVGGV